MKKLIMVALALVVGATFHSVKAQKLGSRTDTLSYAMGMSQTRGLKEYLEEHKGVNLSYMNDFVRGLSKAIATASKAKDKDVAYAAGEEIGWQVVKQLLPAANKEIFGEDATEALSSSLFYQGFLTALTEKGQLMSVSEADSIGHKLYQEYKEATALKKFEANKQAGEQFLKENAQKDGVVTLPSGLQYRVLTQGSGRIAQPTDLVTVKYEGRLIDGTVFDSTERHGGTPATFSPNQVIQGWTEALTLMPEGSKWQLYIPQELAYGSHDTREIPGYSALIFDVEVISVQSADQAETPASED